MDRKLSWLASAGSPDDIDHAIAEVDAAIAMVLAGVARAVRLCNLPGAEDAAFDAAAHAQRAQVTFSLMRHGAQSVTVVVGPRMNRAMPSNAPLASAENPDRGATA